MSAPPTEREVRSRFEEVIDQTTQETTADVTVQWGDADPEARPEGVTWDADAGVLTYDVWDAQRRTLDAVNSGNNDIGPFSRATAPERPCSVRGG